MLGKLQARCLVGTGFVALTFCLSHSMNGWDDFQGGMIDSSQLARTFLATCMHNCMLIPVFVPIYNALAIIHGDRPTPIGLGVCMHICIWHDPTLAILSAFKGGDGDILVCISFASA